MVVSGTALLTAVRRARGQDALRGTLRAATAGLAGAAAGAAAGAGISFAVPVSGFFLNAVMAVLACCCGLIAFGVTAYALDGGDLRAVVARARRRAAGLAPVMSPVRVAYVIATVGTTAGGTGRHVAMLAEGGAARGLDVSVLGPAAARALFAPAADFAPVEVAERPHPARDAAAVLRLRRLLRRAAPDVVHAHGLRAGAAAALALARLPGGRSSGGRLPGWPFVRRRAAPA